MDGVAGRASLCAVDDSNQEYSSAQQSSQCGVALSADAWRVRDRPMAPISVIVIRHLL